ncbi:MAG TPA: hypothetical protein VLU23_13320 [Pseudolabrys sp.]|jgi:hypothetical protein|nr:hypothetical protein [Pseudolabrys sp.]
MKDRFARIADIFIDVGIIALMLVSLLWNPPAFKLNESPALALPENSRRPLVATGDVETKQARRTSW